MLFVIVSSLHVVLISVKTIIFPHKLIVSALEKDQTDSRHKRVVPQIIFFS